MADVHAKQTQFQCDLSEKLDKATRSEENEMNVLREQVTQNGSTCALILSIDGSTPIRYDSSAVFLFCRCWTN